MVNLRFCLNSYAFDPPKNTFHPQRQMEELGITYKYFIPQSAFDAWWFIDCENVSDPLPGYLSVMKDSVTAFPEVKKIIGD